MSMTSQAWSLKRTPGVLVNFKFRLAEDMGSVHIHRSEEMSIIRESKICIRWDVVKCETRNIAVVSI